MTKELGLRDQVSFANSASKGLGKAAAFAFSHEGARAVICTRSNQLKSAEKVVREVTRAEVLASRTDLTIYKGITSLVDRNLVGRSRCRPHPLPHLSTGMLNCSMARGLSSIFKPMIKLTGDSIKENTQPVLRVVDRENAVSSLRLQCYSVKRLAPRDEGCVF